jgi:hypothetical protein
LTALAVLLWTAEPAAARTISWAGHTWDVRPPGFGTPGPNHWSDSEANVEVDGTDLVLAVVKDASGHWTSAEVSNRAHLGYGTYRWVVETRLSDLDSHEVLGMFTYGGSSPSNNEIDIEPSHWGNTAWPTGSATVWQDSLAGRNATRTFEYSDRPPYVNQFTWAPGSVRYLIRDAAGTTLLDWTLTSGVPVPSSEVPTINYWRFENDPPALERRMRLSSFAWAPLGREAELPAPTPPTPGSPAAPAHDAGDSARLRLAIGPRRFAAGRRGRGATISWRATGAAALRLAVQRRTGKGPPVELGVLRRSVDAGSGRMRFRGSVGGRRLRPGRYWLSPVPAAGVRFTPRRLGFTVLPR